MKVIKNIKKKLKYSGTKKKEIFEEEKEKERIKMLERRKLEQMEKYVFFKIFWHPPGRMS